MSRLTTLFVPLALALAAMPAAAQEADPHAHHAAAEEPDPHAHHAAAAEAEDPHAGHRQPMQYADAHPGHHPPPATPIPALSDADRAAAFPALTRHMEHADAVNHFVRFDRLEAWDDAGATGQAWEVGGWLGTDTDRLWLRSEGERVGGETHSADVELLYGHGITPWWDVVGGIRQDVGPHAQTWAAVGVQGLAPRGFVELQATAYVGDGGQVAAEFEAEHQLRLTSRWILESTLEVALHGRDDADRGVGAGLSTAEAGLRLRYEITPRFAPYLGLVHERHFGDTARFRRDDGEADEETRVVAGLRFWF